MRGQGVYEGAVWSMRGQKTKIENKITGKYPHTHNCTLTFSSAVHVILVSVSVRR